MNSIVQLLSNIPSRSIPDFVREKQQSYPKDWVYKPVGIELELTNRCTIQCAGCGQRDEIKRPLDLLTIDDFIDVAKQAAELPIFACSLTGGETLMFLDRIVHFLKALSGIIDVYKINTNGYRFVTPEKTKEVLIQLRDAGFGISNRYIKSVFVVSIGQQTNAGIPIGNSVHCASVFYNVFSPDKTICAINVTDKNIQSARKWSNIFRKEYEKMTGLIHDDQRIPIREFMLNTIATLKRLNMEANLEITIPELFERFKDTYTSWKCLNNLPDKSEDITTLMPKMVLRPNGDIMACPGYGYVHPIGNVKKKPLRAILADANSNPILHSMYTNGLPGFYSMVKKSVPAISKTKLSISYDPCDVCKYLTMEYNRASK
jgi:hypothetical protein